MATYNQFVGICQNVFEQPYYLFTNVKMVSNNNIIIKNTIEKTCVQKNIAVSHPVYQYPKTSITIVLHTI